MKGAKVKGWGSCYQAGDQSGGEITNVSKKLALQVSQGSLFFARGSIKSCLYIAWISVNCCVNINEILVCRLKINHAWSAPSSCI